MTAGVIDAIRERRARRAIDRQRPVARELLERLGEAFRFAPSQGNNQPGRLLFATTEETRSRVFAALTQGNRNWAGAAPVLGAVAAIPSHDPTFTGPEGGVREYWGFDTGLAAAMLMVQATALGLIAHPMAGFDETAVREAFSAPDEVRILAVVAIGYAGDLAELPGDLQVREQAPQRRLPFETVVAFDIWGEPNALSFAEARKAGR